MILPDIFCFCILDYQWPYKEYVFVRSFGGGIVAYPVLFANLWLCGFGLHDGCHMWSKNRSLFVRIWFHIPLLFPRRFMWISLYSEFPLVFWGFWVFFPYFGISGFFPRLRFAIWTTILWMLVTDVHLMSVCTCWWPLFNTFWWSLFRTSNPLGTHNFDSWPLGVLWFGLLSYWCMSSLIHSPFWNTSATSAFYFDIKQDML